MFAFLLVFGVARAYVDGRLDARVIGLAIALAVVLSLIHISEPTRL